MKKHVERSYAIYWIVLISVVVSVNGVKEEISPAVSAHTSTNYIMYSTSITSTPQVNQVDHCRNGTDNCTASLADCITTAPGSYICRCLAGYNGTGYGPEGCREVNECVSGPNVCHLKASCTNTNGSYHCNCTSGYSGNGTYCDDVNECETQGSNNCHRNASCLNTPGSFNCSCNSGFSGNGTHCRDIRKCSRNDGNGEACHVNATCIDTLTVPRCQCHNGFTGNGFNCSDVDECAQNTDNCHEGAVCSNTVGLYMCQCVAPFWGNGSHCINLCTIEKCPTTSQCIVVRDNTECRCPNGQFLKVVENGVRVCATADKVAKVEGLTIKQIYKDAYQNLDSPASRELIRNVEPAILEVLRALYPSVTGIQVTRLYAGSVKIDFAVTLASPNVTSLPTASNIKTSLDKEIKNDKLAGINADTTVGITVADANLCDIGGDNCTTLERCESNSSTSFKCICIDGYLKDNGKCKRISDLARGLLTFTWRQEWNADLANISTHLYKTSSNDINKKLHQSFQVKISTFDVSRLAIYVTSFSMQSPNTAVLAHILYFNQLRPKHAKVNLCDELKAFTYTTDTNLFGFSFVSYDCCFAEVAGDEAFKGSYYFNTTTLHDVTLTECKYNKDKNFTRKCDGSGRNAAAWQSIGKLPNCKPFSKTTEDLIELEQKSICVVNQTTNCLSVVETAKNLSSVIRTGPTVNTSQDVESVSQIVSKIVKGATLNETIVVIQDILQTVSEVINTESKIMEKAENETRSATVILQDLDTLSTRLGESTVNEGEVIVQSTPNVALRVENISPQNYTLLVGLDASSDMSLTQKNEASNDTKYKGEVSIPKGTFDSYPKGFQGRVYAFAFRKSTLFVGNGTRDDTIQSVIISVSLGNETASGDPAVRLKFGKNENDTGESLCSFWNTTATSNISGAWDQSGCTKEDEKDQIVTCACTHFTNFALLLNVDPSVITALELEIITYIGCALSLAGLILTIISHGTIRSLRSRLPSKILVCLSVSLCMVMVLFLAGITRTSSKIGCQVIAALLQYFMLCTFLWMGITAINLYQLIVLVFRRNDTKFFLRANIIAWCAPAIIVIVTGAADADSLAPRDDKQYCFVSGYPFYFGVVLPVAGIILMNIVIIVIMLVKLARNPPVAASKEQTSDVKHQARIAFSCSILLGVTWVFALLAVGNLKYAFQLLFCIFNSLQGFFIFILYTLFNPIVRGEFAKYCTCCKIPGLPGSTGRYTVRSSKTVSTSVIPEASTSGNIS